MSTAATKEDIRQLSIKADQQFEDLMSVMQTFMHRVDDRFNEVENRLDALDQKFERMITTLDGFLARLDAQDKENAIRDRQFERLVEWAHKVSEKTGIPLENL